MTLRNARLAWALVPVVMACAASPALAVQSSAYAVSADLTVDGARGVKLGPLLATAGSTTLGQTYDQPLSSALLARTAVLAPGVSRGAVLAFAEQKAATDASGGMGVDASNASGQAGAANGLLLVQGGAAAVTLDPASTMSAARLPLPALRLQFSKLATTASYARIVPSPSRRSGSTSVASLTLSGSWVGQALNLRGDLAPNTVVLNTPTVKVTVNQQFIPQQPVCLPGQVCPLYRVLETVETRAVVVDLTDAVVNGHKVSGQIIVGDAQAGE